MSKNKENKLVPKLRFPAYVKHKEWNFDRLDNIYYFITTNSFSRDDLNYLNGEVKNIHYGDIHTKFSTLFDITKENVPFINESISLNKFKNENYCKEGDVIFADASEDLKDVGKSIELVNLNNEKLLSGLHTLLARQLKSKLTIGFGGYLFLNDRIKKQIQRESQGAKVLGISATRLSKINIFYPEEKGEQQKIAACLSSLDEVITAESQKLHVLKEHKKGLLQNLFPQEGETAPRVRFKEFEDSGEWKSDIVKNVFSIFQGFAFSSNDSVGNGVRWLKIADVGIQQMNHQSPSFLPGEFKEKYRSFLVKEGDYVIALTRPILNKKLKISKVDNILNESLLNQRVGKLVSNECVDFVYFLLQTSKLISTIEQNIAGSEPPNLSAQQIENIEVYIPSTIEEQQKIANTLSSIDELITAQSQKIEALQLHKKGLLQGLFPNLNEANA